jgi:hypothetical protein
MHIELKDGDGTIIDITDTSDIKGQKHPEANKVFIVRITTMVIFKSITSKIIRL